jgi:two-component system, NtrC family, sensor kinase
VTEEYLSMARLPEPALKKENLSSLVESVLNFSSAQLQHDKISVTSKLAAAQGELLADQNQLRQVLVNLLKNSREAMPNGGALTVSITKVGPRLELRWSDTGVGIAERDRPQIFEPFFTTKRGGTGLGLSLSRQIVELHGGTIGIEPGAGPGTTFVLSFPAV